MGKPIQRVGDPNTAGGVVLMGASSVRVNGRPAAVVGSMVSPHPGKPPIVHAIAVTTGGAKSVKAEGRAINLMGDSDTCRHSRVGGSMDVRAS